MANVFLSRPIFRSTPRLFAPVLYLALILLTILLAVQRRPPVAPCLKASKFDNPVADPRAIVTVGHARFTVLTSRMIRMEWADDGSFEDHASLVFINRRLPVPKFTQSVVAAPQRSRSSSTPASLGSATLPRAAAALRRMTSRSTSLERQARRVDAGHARHRQPARNHADARRSAGRQDGGTNCPGLVSRDGWTLVDDSTRPLFDSADFSFSKGANSPWPWVMPRPAGEREDWYFFATATTTTSTRRLCSGCGTDPLPPRFAFGLGGRAIGPTATRNSTTLSPAFTNTVCRSTYWSSTWTGTSTSSSLWQGRERPVGRRSRLDRLHLEQRSLPAPKLFLDHLHEEGLKPRSISIRRQASGRGRTRTRRWRRRWTSIRLQRIRALRHHQ